VTDDVEFRGFLVAVVKDERYGDIYGLLPLKAKTFKTGSVGFFATGKVEIAGERYQAQVQLVKIGSKDDNNNGE